MNLNALKKFAQGARRKLLSEVASRLDYVLGHDDAYVRAHQGEIGEIRRQLEKKSREQLVEEVGYTWFNRIVALRFMDLRGYTKVRIVSPQAGQVQPELLFQIKQGRTPPEIRSLQAVFDGYLSGTLGSDQPDREIYTTALLGICNDYSRTLPFLFRKVDEYMAVLLPTDLLSESSILTGVQGAIGEDDVQDVEVIGWLYQFYISEKKDQVFGRPKGEKIKKEDIPAATQLFTPHWIVRYMVENSLGRLWRNNRPDTGLAEQMEYYIEGDPEPEFLTIAGPEEITLLDPACGSGHILTYAFDLIYGMYEETGYSAEEIPSLILTNNLYGIDIDTRAAELASFALTMKAREKDRFFFKRGVVPRVIAMEDVSVDLREADIRMSPQLQEAFGYLTEATNFGSLIPVPAEVQGEIEDLLADLDARGDADLFADQAMGQVRSGLRQLGYLAKRYHCVVTNPPYLNATNANPRLKDLLKTEYEEGKADLFAAFIMRGLRIAGQRGYLGMITQHAWMFLKSFENLRRDLLSQHALRSMVHMGPHAFETVGGEIVQTTAFTVMPYMSAITRAQEATNEESPSKPPATVFVRLSDINSHRGKRDAFCQEKYRYKRSQLKLLSIPGAPVAYWISPTWYDLFKDHEPLRSLTISDGQTKSGDNERFLRMHWEVSRDMVGAANRWILHPKGGPFRKWYGNVDTVIDWSEDARRHYRQDRVARLLPNYLWWRKGIVWTLITGGEASFRYLRSDEIFNLAAPAIFLKNETDLMPVLGFLNSPVARSALRFLNPTINMNVGEIRSLPWIAPPDDAERFASECIAFEKADWDARETSFDFLRSPLLNDYRSEPERLHFDEGIISLRWNSMCGRSQALKTAYAQYVDHWGRIFETVRQLEEENNRLFVDLYGLEGAIESGVGASEITMLQDETDIGARSHDEIVFDSQEIMGQLVSYGVGCIFGRYSLDKDGLILVNAGDDLATYLSQIPEPTLRPDESGILPITDDNDFADDLPSQWRTFLRAAFGDEHYEENRRLVEDGLRKRLRPYFLNGFYDDHVKRYKKRPIYWLITSPKGTFQALIYLHRYNRDTVNLFLNDYLRPYQQKLEAKRVSAEHVLTGGGSSQSEKTKAQKRIDEIRKALEELSTWERDVVRPLAEKRIELDLDDGVKVNYGKLGAILAKVKGLNG
jgi:hypothetical protein